MPIRAHTRIHIRAFTHARTRSRGCVARNSLVCLSVSSKSDKVEIPGCRRVGCSSLRVTCIVNALFSLSWPSRRDVLISETFVSARMYNWHNDAILVSCRFSCYIQASSIFRHTNASIQRKEKLLLLFCNIGFFFCRVTREKMPYLTLKDNIFIIINYMSKRKPNKSKISSLYSYFVIIKKVEYF